MKITLEDGKVVELSKESYNALVEACNKDELIIPSNVANYYDGGYMLFNAGHKKRQHMFVDHSDGMFRVYGFGGSPDCQSELKLVDVNSIDDIKVGDLVRNTDNADWRKQNAMNTYGLYVVVEKKDTYISMQYWNTFGRCASTQCHFDAWKHWQVARRIEK